MLWIRKSFDLSSVSFDGADVVTGALLRVWSGFFSVSDALLRSGRLRNDWSPDALAAESSLVEEARREVRTRRRKLVMALSVLGSKASGCEG